MKTLLIALCCCLFSTTVCRAQQPAPILLVYLGDYGVGPPLPPLIALGLLSPTLKISAFEKCASISKYASDGGLAVQLKPEDAKVLSVALRETDASSSSQLKRKLIWFATPDNKVLNLVDSLYAGENIIQHGVMAFDPKDQKFILIYLMETLKPK